MPAESAPAELVARGTAAHLAGDYGPAARDLQRAFTTLHDDGDAAGAFEVAFAIAMVYGTTCRPAQFRGWVEIARQTADQIAGSGSATGSTTGSLAEAYLDLLELHGAILTGDFTSVGRLAPGVVEAGRKHHDPDLITLGTVAVGRSAIYAGDVRAGLARLDEVMAEILAGAPGPLASGLAWCAAIEGCQEIGAVDRLCEWTRSLTTWCQAPPARELFIGHCSVHRGQVLALHGDWDRALTSFEESRCRHEERGDLVAAGWAECGRGDLLRLQGREEQAAAAYRRASTLGCDPHPGLALLWWEQGRRADALAAVHRCLAETVLPAQRVLLVPAAVELLLTAVDSGDAGEAGGAGDTEEALGGLGALAEELDGLAGLTGCASVAAAAAAAHAGVQLARRDPGGALPYARKAVQGWHAVGCPFEVARSRVMLARALAGVGDKASAQEEVEAARDAFSELGALPARAGVESLLDQWGGAAESRLATRPGGLSEREVGVLRLVSGGRSNRQIAAELVISEKTVARHLSNIFTKLDVSTRTAAAAFAFRHGLTSVDGT
ncbi:LuxR C-terminal-related transcriptional regulator [Citricoccus nitrophenolicus]|uniref:LuxR C-terminal-related transcriptional regulator n=1 Tax=Citricoccus nitrophenolicus TaxID=863575 RepID=UPI0039B449D8